MSRWTKYLLCLAGGLFLLCFSAMIYLGIESMKQTIPASAQITQQEANPIESFKTVRQQLRAMQKAQLNDVAHDASSDDELIAMAQRQLLELIQREEQEITIEGILEMRGWQNPVVTVHQDSVNVLLQCEAVTQQESSVILELVCRETGAMSGNVKIIPIK